MYQAFNLCISRDDMPFDNNEFDYYYLKGNSLLEHGEEKFRNDIGKYAGPDGTLSAKAIQDDWFPSIKAHVFLSHSHDDLDIVTALAGWLNEKFEIVSFIDFWVWGYANDLSIQIDNVYSKRKDQDIVGAVLYDYTETQKTSAHVNNILLMALTKMIDSTECLFFVNTPQSNKRGNTCSPWIYSEMMISSVIRRKEWREEFSLNEQAEQSSLKVFYYVNTDHMTELNKHNLMKWLEDYPKNCLEIDMMDQRVDLSPAEEALDFLCKMAEEEKKDKEGKGNEENLELFKIKLDVK